MLPPPAGDEAPQAEQVAIDKDKSLVDSDATDEASIASPAVSSIDAVPSVGAVPTAVDAVAAPTPSAATAAPAPTNAAVGSGGVAAGSNIRVAVRVRPLPAGETRIIEVVGDNAVTVRKEAATGGNEFLSSQRGRTEERQFDRVFGPLATQKEIYLWSCQSLVSTAVQNGCNATIFVYGPTGAGKTHTMFGEPSETEQGLIFRTIREVFDTISGNGKGSIAAANIPALEVKVSFLELYNEKVYDLLHESSNGGGTVCSILEDERRGLLKIHGLREVPVACEEEALQQLRAGTQLRKVEATAANNRSSRSHAVFGLHLERNVVGGTAGNGFDFGGNCHSKICLIDLAGSERASHTQNVGSALRDGAKINQSLLALANCINALGERQGSEYRDGKTTPQRKPPYRDSKLTLLLKSSLIGGGLVSMIACVHPGKAHFEDTCNTLEYAKRTSTVKSTVVVRREPAPAPPARPPAAPEPPTPHSPPHVGGVESVGHAAFEDAAIDSDPGVRKTRRRMEGRSSSRSNPRGAGSAPAGNRYRRSRGGTGDGIPDGGPGGNGRKSMTPTAAGAGGGVPAGDRERDGRTSLRNGSKIGRAASEGPALGIAGCVDGADLAHFDVGVRDSPLSRACVSLPSSAVANGSRSGSPIEIPEPPAQPKWGQPAPASASDGFAVPGPFARAAGMVRSASAAGMSKDQRRPALPLAPSSPPFLPTPGNPRPPGRWAGERNDAGLVPLSHRPPSGKMATADPCNASREVLLRIVESVQSEKAALDAQLQAISAERDRLEAECRRLRAANLEKDQQLAILLNGHAGKAPASPDVLSVSASVEELNFTPGRGDDARASAHNSVQADWREDAL